MSAGAWILLAIVIAVVLLWGLPRVFRWRRTGTGETSSGSWSTTPLARG